MQIHQLQPKHRNKGKKRVGRGGRKGTYSGRGMKGQKQRAGRKMVPLIREIIKRYPKLRGYRFNTKENYQLTLNVGFLEKKFQEGDLVSPQTLIEKRIIHKIKGKTPSIKILATGAIKKPLIIENCQLSKKAKSEIEKAGGTIK